MYGRRKGKKKMGKEECKGKRKRKKNIKKHGKPTEEKQRASLMGWETQGKTMKEDTRKYEKRKRGMKKKTGLK